MKFYASWYFYCLDLWGTHQLCSSNPMTDESGGARGFDCCWVFGCQFICCWAFVLSHYLVSLLNLNCVTSWTPNYSRPGLRATGMDFPVELGLVQRQFHELGCLREVLVHCCFWPNWMMRSWTNWAEASVFCRSCFLSLCCCRRHVGICYCNGLCAGQLCPRCRPKAAADRRTHPCSECSWCGARHLLSDSHSQSVEPTVLYSLSSILHWSVQLMYASDY